MKIFLQKKNFFEFRGVGSAEIELCGKSVMTCMKERLNPEPGDPQVLDEDFVVLYPVYPFLERETLFSYLDEREGSYSFPGGYVRRCGCFSEGAERKSAQTLGRGLFSLSDLPYFLALAQEKSAKLHLMRGALVEEGAEVSFAADIEEGAVIRRGARVCGKSSIGKNAEIGYGSEIIDSRIGAGSLIRSSLLCGCEVGKDCRIGPFLSMTKARIPDGALILPKDPPGNF